MPPVAPVIRTVEGCCQDRREDGRWVICPIVLSWFMVSLVSREPAICNDRSGSTFTLQILSSGASIVYIGEKALRSTSNITPLLGTDGEGQ